MTATTVRAVLDAGAAQSPALGAPGRPWLTYAALRHLGAVREHDRYTVVAPGSAATTV
jgi:hypothetical protein